MNIDEIALRSIIREEMKSVLKEVGLHDDDAGNDVRDLRSDYRLAWHEEDHLADHCSRRDSLCFGHTDAGGVV